MILSIKWMFFRCLVWISNLRNRQKLGYAIETKTATSDSVSSYLWIYATTIGEINAIWPLIDALEQAYPKKAIVFLSDHEIYSEAIAKKFPKAIRVFFDQSFTNFEHILDQFPAELFIVAEIPCLLSDAPCRLPFEIVYRLKRRGVPLIAVNAWLYGYQPSCRMDSIEKLLFRNDFLRMFDSVMVQTNGVRNDLVSHGCDPAKLLVVGNAKWDLFHFLEIDKDITKRDLALSLIADSFQYVITAGCIADLEDSKLVLESFSIIKKHYKNSLLVIAPRHPEKPHLLQGIIAQIRSLGMKFQRKSQAEAHMQYTDVFILDTFGELQNYYSICTLAFVGRNHNILEPLAYCKRVYVSHGWEETFPSYPVYEYLLEAELVEEKATPELLASAVLQEFKSGSGLKHEIVQRAIRAQQGASKRQLDVISTFFDPENNSI